VFQPLINYATKFGWWTQAIKWDYFQYFHDHWEMSVTMVFGAMVAGEESMPKLPNNGTKA